MDLHTVTEIRPARTRADLAALDAATVVLAGGSWLFSEPQPATSTLLDITGFGWPPLTVHADGLSVAATCTLAELSRLPSRPGWRAHPVFFQACTALFGSFKVWNVA